VLDHDHVQASGRRAPVLIDKTGTLTLGRPHITDMITVDGHTDNALLALAAVIAGFAKDDALCVGRRAGPAACATGTSNRIRRYIVSRVDVCQSRRTNTVHHDRASSDDFAASPSTGMA
jgi:hypothetical protein